MTNTQLSVSLKTLKIIDKICKTFVQNLASKPEVCDSHDMFVRTNGQILSIISQKHSDEFIKFKHMSRLVGKPTMWFPNRSDTNEAVQSQKMVRGWILD